MSNRTCKILGHPASKKRLLNSLHPPPFMKTKRPLILLSITSLLLALCAPTFGASITNNFDTSYDYFVNGITGDPNWDGVYLNFGDIQGGNPGGSGNGATTSANANGSPNTLSITSTRGDWSAPGDDGFFI